MAKTCLDVFWLTWSPNAPTSKIFNFRNDHASFNVACDHGSEHADMLSNLMNASSRFCRNTRKTAAGQQPTASSRPPRGLGHADTHNPPSHARQLGPAGVGVEAGVHTRPCWPVLLWHPRCLCLHHIRALPWSCPHLRVDMVRPHPRCCHCQQAVAAAPQGRSHLLLKSVRAWQPPGRCAQGTGCADTRPLAAHTQHGPARHRCCEEKHERAQYRQRCGGS